MSDWLIVLSLPSLIVAVLAVIARGASPERLLNVAAIFCLSVCGVCIAAVVAAMAVLALATWVEALARVMGGES